MPHIAGIVKRRLPDNGGVFSACRSVISGTIKCQMSGKPRPLDAIRQCRNLDWLILTKRPQNVLKMLPSDWGSQGWPHVWLGATVENMIEAGRRNLPDCLGVWRAANGGFVLDVLYRQ